MADMKIFANPDETRENVSIQLDMNGSPLGHINLDPTAVAHHIEATAKARAALAEEVPRDLDPGARVFTAPDPVWRTAIAKGPVFDGVLLALRHPGLGWLGFGFPANEARALAQSLEALAGPPPKSQKASRGPPKATRGA